MNCFPALCRTLEEIFSATPHTEDELDYASSTLILAGLLQLYSRSPLYASHRSRLDSFPNLKSSPGECNEPASSHLQSAQNPGPSIARPSPDELATAGFFHTGSGDETVCPACGLGLRDWQATDQPEACHLAYSSAQLTLTTGDVSELQPVPSFPCLYLTVRRLLTSELPLARKSLVPVGFVQSVCSLPGVVTPPCSKAVDDRFNKLAPEFASLADRLRAIVHIMSSPPSPQGWPIENARALGHSDDLIVLGLWRLQTESTEWSLACPSKSALHLDPQATAELLRSILRLQESFAMSLRQYSLFDAGSDDGDIEDTLSGSSDPDLTAEDAETAALSRCRFRRIHPTISQVSNDSTSSPASVDSNGVPTKRIRLPKLHQFLCWWSNRWATEITTAAGERRCS